MKYSEREKVISLRKNNRLSYGEIRKKVNVSKSTLSRWLKEFPLSDEELYKLRKDNWDKTEVSREKFRNTMRKKRDLRAKQIYEKQKNFFYNIKSRERFISGLVLYLAEGSKTNPYSIVLTNTDPKILKFFVRWMNEFLEVRPERIRGQLHLYENMNIAKEKKYWQDQLGFNAKQFYKVQIRKTRKNTYTYKEGFRHGTCQVSYASGERKMLLMESIRAFMDNCYVDLRV